MSEWTARHDDSKIPQHVRSERVVTLGSCGSSAKLPVTEARNPDRVPIRAHFEYVPNEETISIGAMNRIRESWAGATERAAPIVSTFWTSNTQAWQVITVMFAQGQRKTSEVR